MFDKLVGPFLIWLAAVVSQTGVLSENESLKILGRKIAKKQIALTLILVASLGMLWHVYQAWETKQEIKSVNEENKRLRDENSKLFCEASGGTMVKDVAYVVDDEKPIVFEFKPEIVDKQSADFAGTQPDEIVYRLSDRITLKKDGIVLTGEEVDDLEAIASFEGKLYLLTSHSNSKKKGAKKPERQKLLEVSLDPQTRGVVTNSTDNLRNALEKHVGAALADAYVNEDHITEFLHIEGLAIDPQGKAYLGLRAPLTKDEEAIVFSAKLSDLFSKDKELQFEVFRLNLWYQNDNDNHNRVHYGIVSLDYDAQSRELLVVGNSPKNSGY
ncbi:MAG TPA: hypothetical protein VJS64_00695, partial [Pyrinomonadaceae bacterium]|nr:hypothetical protein [Pyrinomonadaceae bacterium]